MPRRTARGALLLALLLTMLLTVGCGASDPPPTSPLDDGGDTATAVVGVPSVLPTFPATSTVVPGEGGGTGDPERLAGLAIEAIAEWLGEAETLFRLVGVEAVDWPNACLGVERPGYACAEVVTPGARITVQTFGGGATYFVHADLAGHLAWAPLMDAEREVATVDAATGRIPLVAVDGSDEMGAELLVVPGSRLDVALDDLAEGDRIHVAVAPSPQPDADAAPIVWLVRAAD